MQRSAIVSARPSP